MKRTSEKPTWAVIFDMDGVVVDNNVWHMKAWRIFAKNHHVALHEDVFLKYIFGRTLRQSIHFLFGHELSPQLIKQYSDEKEKIYRRLYAGHVTALKGLKKLLEALQRANIPYSMATSAPPANVRFIMQKTKLGKYFPTIIDGSDVRHGKPHPEPYVKAAKQVGCRPSNCVVFEDSISGVTSAKRAGTVVVGVATTHTAHELHKLKVKAVIEDFRHTTPETIEKLVHKAKRH